MSHNEAAKSPLAAVLELHQQCTRAATLGRARALNEHYEHVIALRARGFDIVGHRQVFLDPQDNSEYDGTRRPPITETLSAAPQTPISASEYDQLLQEAEASCAAYDAEHPEQEAQEDLEDLEWYRAEMNGRLSLLLESVQRAMKQVDPEDVEDVRDEVSKLALLLAIFSSEVANVVDLEVSIEQHALKPLAMGHHEDVIFVREKNRLYRKRYALEEAQKRETRESLAACTAALEEAAVVTANYAAAVGAMGQQPVNVAPGAILETMEKLAKRNTPLANKLLRQADAAAPIAMGHPYAPFPKSNAEAQADEVPYHPV